MRSSDARSCGRRPCGKGTVSICSGRSSPIRRRAAACAPRRDRFLEGFTSEIGGRLRQAAAEAKANAARAQDPDRGGRSVALVLADKAKRVESELKAKVGRLSTSRLSGSLSYSGFEQGRAAGRDATLTRGSVPDSRAPALPTI